MRQQCIRLKLLFVSMCVLTGTACTNLLHRVGEDDKSDNTPTEATETTDQGVEFFDGSFQDAIAQATQDEKLVFVFVYTQERGASIVMQESVFPLQEVGEYINERFISFKLDIAERSQHGAVIASRFEELIPPMYLIFDADGNEIGRARGGTTADQFMLMIGRALGESASTIDEMQTQYDSGDRSPAFIQQYLMDAIVELGLLKFDSEDTAQIYFEEASKYRQIAREYFASRSYSELINETDSHLILYYWDGMPRGDDLVEFIIEHYDEFIRVSSEPALAQFTLYATLVAVGLAASAADDHYLKYVDALRDSPLTAAVEYERKRFPDSRLLPKRVKEYFEPVYLGAKQDWDGLYDFYKKKLEESGDYILGTDFTWTMMQLSRSDNKKHHDLAFELGRRGFEQNKKDSHTAGMYVLGLVMLEKRNKARSIAEEFRMGLSDSEVDQENLKIFNEMTTTLLDESD